MKSTKCNKDIDKVALLSPTTEKKRQQKCKECTNDWFDNLTVDAFITMNEDRLKEEEKRFLKSHPALLGEFAEFVIKLYDPMKEYKVTRLTVVDWTKNAKVGRLVERHDIKVSLDYQDSGRTLKVFMEDKEDE